MSVDHEEAAVDSTTTATTTASRPFALLTTSFIDGTWEDGPGDSGIQLVSPVSGELLGTVAHSSRSQVERAVAAARRALDGPWRDYSPQDRADVLRAAAELLRANQAELGELVLTDLGTPISMSAANTTGATDVLAYYAEKALSGPRGGYIEKLPPHPATGAAPSELHRIPVGVVAAMPAVNFPIALAVWKIGGAIASGCTTVLMPSPPSARIIVRLVELFEQLGLPPGVVNLVCGEREVGQWLTSDPGVDLVSFTGSDSVGAQILEQAAPHLTKAVLELGGKSPNIFLPGTDLEAALLLSVDKFTRNAGQQCGAWTRMLVHESQADEVERRLIPLIEGLRVGDPRDPETVAGPVLNRAHQVRVQKMVDAAVADGARVVARTPDVPGDGFFIAPTVVTDLDPDAPLCQQELFAPIATLHRYSSLDEAIAIANNSSYGLCANIYGDEATARRIALRIRVGTVTINGGGAKRPDAPWGGRLRSGLGTELGEDGFSEFFDTVHLQGAT
ncbi:aldehyde dehydrogenase [Acrocarpospora pleiomorpha]|uniref:Aldehyde dehydrogenase n=1 Tax=Acrocarpospora pleiomorpha TaxID=90975 RepID=A0A5M3XXT0_9ACTN|nr:aldehyde dehydrogenase family protein [Acrocarpospora pleiomorpha]GES25760.1 aldehyde dehydrogenase [Acrocarpospora pleiomorpha]